MDNVKYIGMDVHKETISIAVRNSSGKLLVVCNPRRNALLKEGSKSDRIDAKKLAELLRNGALSAVYHGENGLRMLKELSRSYLTISKDLVRVMNRLKALYRSWAIPCVGTQVYAPRYRSEWLSKIREPGVRRRAELYYQQLDALQRLSGLTRSECSSREEPLPIPFRSAPGFFFYWFGGLDSASLVSDSHHKSVGLPIGVMLSLIYCT